MQLAIQQVFFPFDLLAPQRNARSPRRKIFRGVFRVNKIARIYYEMSNPEVLSHSHRMRFARDALFAARHAVRTRAAWYNVWVEHPELSVHLDYKIQTI
jgi:hypothetical protein